ncbi:protein-serine/threonine phosphatase [Clostridia bacterium]|nr:protein-serine/threonine phosphatase [Clostridia bacterium]
MNVFGDTNVGKVRENNEDSFFYSDEPVAGLPNLYIVADGMGGHKCGEVASSKAIEFFREYLLEEPSDEGIMDRLVGAIVFANRAVYEMSLTGEEYEGMGTTLSACSLDGNKLYIAHIGDSRIYAVNPDDAVQLTSDHSFINEMVKNGQLSLEQARAHPQRHMLTRALGVERYVQADGYIAELASGTKVLLCSDGLSNMVAPPFFSKIASESENNAEVVRRLIDEALENGGADNCTVIVFDI